MVVSQTKAPDDIVDPYRPGGLFQGPLSTFNFIMADMLAIRLTFIYKKALALHEPPPPELTDLALELCRSFEAIEYSSFMPAEAVLKAQGWLGIASLFLPKDEKHTLWVSPIGFCPLSIWAPSLPPPPHSV